MGNISENPYKFEKNIVHVPSHKTLNTPLGRGTVRSSEGAGVFRYDASHSTRSRTHNVGLVEYEVQFGVHLVVVERHEQRVDDDAQGDVELDERVEDDEREPLLELQPRPSAVPHAERVDELQQPHLELLAERRLLVVLVFFLVLAAVRGLVICRKHVHRGHCTNPGTHESTAPVITINITHVIH